MDFITELVSYDFTVEHEINTFVLIGGISFLAVLLWLLDKIILYVYKMSKLEKDMQERKLWMSRRIPDGYRGRYFTFN